MTYQTDETISLTNEADSNLPKEESSSHHKWLGATATGRRLLLAGGFVGTTVTFGLLLKGHGFPTTSLLQMKCCTKNDSKSCTVKSETTGRANYKRTFWTCDELTSRSCHYDYGPNGHRCCTDTDYLKWYPFDLFSGNQKCR